MPDDRLEQAETLEHATDHILEEARMLLPGIQAIFGFQLIAVFNQCFYERVSQAERWLHLAAILSVILAMALVLAPAAYHRLAEPRTVSPRLVRIGTAAISLSLLPLALAVAGDVFIITRLISSSVAIAGCVSGSTLALLVSMWFAWPLLMRAVRHHRYRRDRAMLTG